MFKPRLLGLNSGEFPYGEQKARLACILCEVIKGMSSKSLFTPPKLGFPLGLGMATFGVIKVETLFEGTERSISTLCTPKVADPPPSP